MDTLKIKEALINSHELTESTDFFPGHAQMYVRGPIFPDVTIAPVSSEEKIAAEEDPVSDDELSSVSSQEDNHLNVAVEQSSPEALSHFWQEAQSSAGLMMPPPLDNNNHEIDQDGLTQAPPSSPNY